MLGRYKYREYQSSDKKLQTYFQKTIFLFRGWKSPYEHDKELALSYGAEEVRRLFVELKLLAIKDKVAYEEKHGADSYREAKAVNDLDALTFVNQVIKKFKPKPIEPEEEKLINGDEPIEIISQSSPSDNKLSSAEESSVPNKPVCDEQLEDVNIVETSASYGSLSSMSYR